MPARSIVRPTLSGRFSNTPASSPTTINTSPNQGVAAPPSSATQPAAAAPAATTQFQGTGYNRTVQVQFTAPNGARGIVELTPQGAQITKNPTFTEPIKNTRGQVVGTGTFDYAVSGKEITSKLISFTGTTQTTQINTTTNTAIGTISEIGAISYAYALKNGELVPEITGSTGGIYYQSARQQSQYNKAQQALQQAEFNLQYGTHLEDIIIPQLAAQSVAAGEKGEYNYSTALFYALQAYTQNANQLLFQPVFTKGEFAGYNASGLVTAATAVMNANKPEEVAALTTTGIKPLQVQVSDAIYGSVGGKTQELGTLQFTPTETSTGLSFSYAGFTPSIVQVSGTGYYAGIYTSYNPSTGQLAINPKNYAYVTGNLQTTTLLNGEVLSTITMPSGFGIGAQFGSLNVINAKNIPISNSEYGGALESYSSFGGVGSYKLTYPGTFPSLISEAASLGKGVSITYSELRQFNPATGAISYTSSNSISIPGLGTQALPQAPTTQAYTYKGSKYTFSFNPSSATYDISGVAQPAKTDFFAAMKRSVAALRDQETIQYNFGTLGGVTGYEVTTASGLQSGANYATPKPVAEGNVAQPTFMGNALVLPAQQYLKYISNVDANTNAYELSVSLNAQQAQINQSNAQLPVIGGTLVAISKYFNPGFKAIEGGEEVRAGYTIQGLETFGAGLVQGEAPVFIVMEPAAALTNAAISGSAQAATNFIAAKPLSSGVATAASVGAVAGGIFGATLPASTTDIQAAKTVGINAVRLGLGFGAFNTALTVSELAFGGSPAPSSGATGGISPKTQSQASAGKAQSSFSLLSNSTPSEYLNVGLSSFAEGFTIGTEVSGVVGTLGTTLTGAAKTSTTAKAIQSLIQNTALVTVGTGSLTAGTTLAEGGTLRQAVVGGVTSAATTYGFFALEAQLNPQLQLESEGEPSKVIAVRSGPEGQGSGTVVSSIAKDYNEVVLSADQQDAIRSIAAKTTIENLQTQSDAIARILKTTPAELEITTELPPGATGAYSTKYSLIGIDPNQPADELPQTIIHENIHNFFAKGNQDIVNSYHYTADMATYLNELGYARDLFKDEGIAFDLTSRILSQSGGVYLSSGGELTDISIEEEGTVRTGKYGSAEYRAVVNTPYKNGNIMDVYTGAAKTLTVDSATSSEQSLIFESNAKVERTVTINPTKLRSFLGLGAKVITDEFFVTAPEAVSTLLGENPAVVVSQPQGITTSSELRDVYSVKGLTSSGQSTIFKQSISTPLGQEWLGEAGNTEGFNFVGKTSKLVMYEVGPGDELPSAKDLLGGSSDEMKVSPYEGPKSSTMKPFGPSAEIPTATPPEVSGATSVSPSISPSASPIPSASPSSGIGEAQMQLTSTMPKTQVAATSSSVFSAGAPVYAGAEETTYALPLVRSGTRSMMQPLGSIGSINPVTSRTSKVSIVGIDPYAIAKQQPASNLITGTYRTQLQPSKQGIINSNKLSDILNNSSLTNRTSKLNVGVHQPYAQSQNQPLAQPFVQLHPQTQKQPSQQVHEQPNPQPYRTPPPTLTPPDVPTYELAFAAAPNRPVKPTKPTKRAHPQPPQATFHYVNDLTSALFHIKGSKKNKIYGSFGFFRPV